MAKLAFELNQSLDGYVDHEAFGPPDPSLFRHFIERVRNLAGMVYGRRMYEVMRYWDEDLPDWGADERERRERGNESGRTERMVPSSRWTASDCRTAGHSNDPVRTSPSRT